MGANSLIICSGDENDVTVDGMTTSISRSPSTAYLEGAASAFDITGDTFHYYTLVKTADAADRDAIETDWKAVSADLTRASRRVVRRCLR